jgi:glutathione S-transferase
MPTLHGAGLSPFVRKVRVVLAEKGIAYDHDPIVPFAAGPEYKKKSPLGKIPCYSPKEGVDIPDSSVIIAYLERTHPSTPFYPANAEDFARALFLEEYADSAVVQACGTVFFQRFVAPRFLGQPTDDKLVQAAINEQLPPLLAYLNEQIAGKEYFVGNQLTVADVAVTSPFINFMHAGEKVDAAKYPHLAKYLEKMMARPSFAKLIAEEKAFFQQAA